MIRVFLDTLLEPIPVSRSSHCHVLELDIQVPALLQYSASMQKLEWAKRAFTFCQHPLAMHTGRQAAVAGEFASWCRRRDVWLATHDPHALQLEEFCGALDLSSELRVLRGMERRIEAESLISERVARSDLASPAVM